MRTLFKKLGFLTVVAVYLLILVGGIVRSTGAGMGCPDWPRCFGAWIPPTDVSQLPENYQEIYSQKRADKNLRLATYLTYLGFTSLAHRITTDKSILKEAPFNAMKTWIEYINRLIGALIGLLIVATFIASLSYRKTDLSIVIFSFLSVVLVLFQGWIGSIVVSTNLLPGMVSLHMVLALLLVCLIIYTIVRSQPHFSALETIHFSHTKLIFLLITALLLSLLQIFMGIQVREHVDTISTQLNNQQRDTWIAQIGSIFYIHRSFSWLVLLIHAFIVYFLWKKLPEKRMLFRLSYLLLAIVTAEILTGAAMGYFAIPAFLQPIHLLLANLAIGLQFLMILFVKKSQQKNPL